MRLINPQKMLTHNNNVTNALIYWPPKDITALTGKGMNPKSQVVRIAPPVIDTISITRPANRKPAPGPAIDIKISCQGDNATLAQPPPHDIDSGTVSPPEKCSTM